MLIPWDVSAETPIGAQYWVRSGFAEDPTSHVGVPPLAVPWSRVSTAYLLYLLRCSRGKTRAVVAENT